MHYNFISYIESYFSSCCKPAVQSITNKGEVYPHNHHSLTESLQINIIVKSNETSVPCISMKLSRSERHLEEGFSLKLFCSPTSLGNRELPYLPYIMKYAVKMSSYY